MAHIDAGKTTTTERILYYTGKRHKIGEVHDGAATMDWMEQEQERGITITSAATTAFWNDKRLNIIDTPGHVDFTIEVERRCACSTARSACSTATRASSRRPRPSGARPTSTTFRASCSSTRWTRSAPTSIAASTRSRPLGGRPVCIQLPIGSESNFKGLIDLVRMKAVIWEDEGLGAKYHDEEIPADMLGAGRGVSPQHGRERRRTRRRGDGGLPQRRRARVDDAASACIRKAVRQIAFYPILCGSAFKNKGVQPLLDAVVDYLPSPVESGAIKGIDVDTGDGSRCACRATTSRSRCSASRSWTTRSSARSPSAASIPASWRSGTTVLNSTKDKNERVGRMLLMHANNREDIKEAYAGDIVALAGLKDTRTGDTLCDPQKPVILEKMDFPEPVIEIAIEPKSKADQEKLGVALAKLAAEDPSFRVSTDQESGQTILKGMGELHLDIKVDILQAHLQGRRQHRRAAGGLSRDADQARPRSTTPTRSRPAARASSPG